MNNWFEIPNRIFQKAKCHHQIRTDYKFCFEYTNTSSVIIICLNLLFCTWPPMNILQIPIFLQIKLRRLKLERPPADIIPWQFGDFKF